MTAAASAVYAANPSLLIFFSGLESDFNIEPIVGGSTAIEPSFSFKVTDYEWAHKFVLEMHEYDENISSSCTVYKLALLSFGFDATTKNGGNRAPLVITEFGYDQTDSNGAYKGDYAQCLLGYMVERELGWMLWNVAGSYYIREGAQDTDESYGMLHLLCSNSTNPSISANLVCVKASSIINGMGTAGLTLWPSFKPEFNKLMQHMDSNEVN